MNMTAPLTAIREDWQDLLHHAGLRRPAGWDDLMTVAVKEAAENAADVTQGPIIVIRARLQTIEADLRDEPFAAPDADHIRLVIEEGMAATPAGSWDSVITRSVIAATAGSPAPDDE